MPANTPFPLGSHLNDLYQAFFPDIPSGSSSPASESESGSEPETPSGRCESCKNETLLGECESCRNDSCKKDTTMIGFTESDEDHEFPEIPEVTDIGTWSELSKYLTAYHPTSQDSFEKMRYVDVHLNCDICQTRRLRLPDWIDSTAYGCGDHDSEDICVLPCGHFFGHSCIRTWMNTNKDGVPSCPKCRFPLLYPECEHEVNLRRLHDLRDFAPDDLIAKVPNTRMHILSYDGKTFLDISPEASEIFDAEVNFGVPDECHSCAKHRMLQRWERIRRQRALW